MDTKIADCLNDVLEKLDETILQAVAPAELARAWYSVLETIRADILDVSAFSFYLITASAQITWAESGEALETRHFYLFPEPLGPDKDRLGNESVEVGPETAEADVWQRQMPRSWYVSEEKSGYICRPLYSSIATIAFKREHPPIEFEEQLFARLAPVVERMVRRYVDLERIHVLSEQTSNDSARVENLGRSQEVDADLVALHDGSYDLFGDDVDSVSKKIIRLVIERLDFDRAGIFLIQNEAGLLRGSWGVDEAGNLVQIASTSLPLHTERPEQRSELALVALGELEYYLTQSLDGSNIKSVEGDIRANAAVPMRVGDRIVGALVIDNYFSNRPIEHKQLYSLMILANQGAAALENARIYQQVRDSEKRYAGLYIEAQESRLRLRHLSQRLVEAQESERRHLARELHDEISQILTGLNLTMAVAAELPEAAMREKLDKAQRLVNELTVQVRNLSLELRPSMLDDQGLRPALVWLVRRYHDRSGITVDFKHSGIEHRFTSEIETAIYRIVQEALTNAARYADIDRVRVCVEVSRSDRLCVEVVDRGCGFELHKLEPTCQNGLSGMRERAELLGGELKIESAPGHGTRIQAQIPLETGAVP